ncbi:hypothetical protein AAF712_001080 [Marasmius tenuissimus]|uniref:Phospholipid/glycerol acyltransferase domain-containing protein n=1 Tax=Marasmius tenuissimus TaxID=585030 RepID=A0ABR3AFM4_9AGAR
MTVSQSLLFAQPISARPPITWRRKLIALCFGVLFNLGCIMLNGSQFVFLLPLRILPFEWSRKLYDEGIRYTKGAFGCLMSAYLPSRWFICLKSSADVPVNRAVLMCQWFAPTKLVITFETNGKGAFREDEIEHIVVKNKKGEVVSLNLPEKFVYIANHQIYADWWYAWCFFYYIGQGVHEHVYITLKKSLQWVPIVGWVRIAPFDWPRGGLIHLGIQGMQFFNFIFLARSWASDRVQLARHLSTLGKSAEREDHPLAFILYPEGTLVSKDTRPISRKFADKTGISDMTNILLPRSTGLHYSLRSLAPRVKDLRMLDVTMVYPGIPPLGYGQSYYTLRSIFLDGIPPPAIHMHLRMFDVRKDVPIGDLSATNPTTLPKSSEDKRAVEVEIPEAEKAAFDLWLRELWTEKDESISRFYDTGRLSVSSSSPIEIPLRLRRTKEVFDAFGFFLPVAFVYAVRKMFN